jgi:hypothetical protein
MKQMDGVKDYVLNREGLNGTPCIEMNFFTWETMLRGIAEHSEISSSHSTV